MSAWRTGIRTGWIVGGLELARPEWRVQVLDEQLAPESRGDHIVLGGWPGTRWRAKPHDVGQLTLGVALVGDGRADLQRLLGLLRDQVRTDSRQQEVVRRWVRDDGWVEHRQATAEIHVRPPAQQHAAAGLARASLDLLLADPYWYQPERTVEVDGADVAVWHPGDVHSLHVTVTLAGPGTPSVENTTTGDKLEATVTLADGESIIVDSWEGTAVDGDTGASRLGDVDWRGRFALRLAPGRNRLTTVDGPVTIAFEPAFAASG